MSRAQKRRESVGCFGQKENIKRQSLLKSLKEHKSSSRSKINELVLDYLPADRDMQNKIYKIGNLLAKLKRRQQIYLSDNKEWTLKK